MGQQTQPQSQLSPKAKDNLRKNAELRQKDSKFVKIQAGEKRTLEFNPEKLVTTLHQPDNTKPFHLFFGRVI